MLTFLEEAVAAGVARVEVAGDVPLFYFVVLCLKVVYQSLILICFLL